MSVHRSTEEPRKLKNLVVSRVDLVDRPANPGAKVTIFKREDVTKVGRKLSQSNLDKLQETIARLTELVESATLEKTACESSVQLNRMKEERMESITKLKDAVNGLAEAEDVAKSVEDIAASVDALGEELTASIESAKEEAVKEFTDQLAELADSEVEKDVSKRDDVPEDVRKEFDSLRKQAEEDRTRIEKMEHDKALSEVVAKAEREFSHVGPSDELGPALLAVKQAVPDAYEVIERAFSSANGKIGEGTIYKTYGSPGTSTNDTDARLDAAVAKIRESDPTLSEERAIAKALQADPSLFDTTQPAERG